MRIAALWIDIQNDFMDDGALPVPGAYASAERTAKFVKDHGSELDLTVVTLDCHQGLHVAHPIMWVNYEGKHPDPLTTILAKDYEEGKYRLTKPGFIVYAEMDPNTQKLRPVTMKEWISTKYLRSVEAGRSPLTIWPPHCLIGGPGNNLSPEFEKAIREYEQRRPVYFLSKGSNICTEHYSAFGAEVPIPNDGATSLNTDVLNLFLNFDMVLFGGQELFHCVRWSAQDLFAQAGGDTLEKFILLRDTTDVIPVFEDEANKWIAEMQAKGMKVETTETVFK